MKIGEILRDRQADVYKQLNSKPKSNKKRRRSRRRENQGLTFSQVEQLMKHDSYSRGRGGAIRQRTWSE